MSQQEQPRDSPNTAARAQNQAATRRVIVTAGGIVASATLLVTAVAAVPVVQPYLCDTFGFPCLEGPASENGTEVASITAVVELAPLEAGGVSEPPRTSWTRELRIDTDIDPALLAIHYPSEARANGLEGSGYLECEIGADAATCIQATGYPSNAVFGEAAMRLAPHLVFTTRVRDGRPVTCRAIVRVRFLLAPG